MERRGVVAPDEFEGVFGAGDGLALVLGSLGEGVGRDVTEIVEHVRELYEPGLPGGLNEALEVLVLALGLGDGHVLREGCDAAGYVRAEEIGDVVVIGRGVLDGVVEQRGGERDLVGAFEHARNREGDARYVQAHDAIMRAIESVLVQGPRTPDMGGTASTTEMGMAIAALL